jgi:integrase
LGLLIDEWQRLHLSNRRPSYREEAPAALRRAFAEYLDRPAAQLSRQVVIDLLDRMAESGCVAMHIRVRAYGHACYRWALRRGKVPSDPFADLPDYGGVRARDRVLSDEELCAVWRAAEAMPYPFGPLIRLLALTLCRRAEAAKMRWSEVSRDLTTWTIPAERMKRGRPHVVALPAAARAILADLPRFEGCDWVFTTNCRMPVSGFSKVKERLDRLSGVSGWRLHDLRRTGFPPSRGLVWMRWWPICCWRINRLDCRARRKSTSCTISGRNAPARWRSGRGTSGAAPSASPPTRLSRLKRRARR